MQFSIALNVLENELEECAVFCSENGVGIEVTAFAFPGTLDQHYRVSIERHRKALEEVDLISFHGPFIDLFVTSPDPAIVDVCKKRHEAALQAAAEIGAAIYVAHLNSIPLIMNKAYQDKFIDKAVGFWLPFAEEAGKHNMTIVLENMWERDPGLQKEVVKKVNHSHLKASFDNGHALVFSDKPAKHWINELGQDMVHCHLHDNDGKYDHHWAIGEGKEDWDQLIEALKTYSPQTTIVLENDSFNLNKMSFQQLNKLLEKQI